MHQTNPVATIPQESVADISELEQKIKKTTNKDVVCVVYEKT